MISVGLCRPRWGELPELLAGFKGPTSKRGEGNGGVGRGGKGWEWREWVGRGGKLSRGLMGKGSEGGMGRGDEMGGKKGSREREEGRGKGRAGGALCK